MQTLYICERISNLLHLKSREIYSMEEWMRNKMSTRIKIIYSHARNIDIYQESI